MNRPSLAPYDWHIRPEHEIATFERTTSEIYPVKDNVAMMVTSSFGGVPVDTWFVFVRFMVAIDQHVYTTLEYVDKAVTLTDARNVARNLAWIAFGFDISTYDLPF